MRLIPKDVEIAAGLRLLSAIQAVYERTDGRLGSQIGPLLHHQWDTDETPLGTEFDRSQPNRPTRHWALGDNACHSGRLQWLG